MSDDLGVSDWIKVMVYYANGLKEPKPDLTMLNLPFFFKIDAWITQNPYGVSHGFITTVLEFLGTNELFNLVEPYHIRSLQACFAQFQREFLDYYRAGSVKAHLRF